MSFAVCLLVLVCLLIGESKEAKTATVAAARVVPAASQISQLPSGSQDAVPISLLIRNDGDQDDRLLGGSTSVAEQVLLRRTRFERGRPATVLVPGGIAIPAGATINLEPGMSHVALLGLTSDLIQGETFPLSLCFEHAGKATITARVRRRVDAAGFTPLPEVSVGDLTIVHASAPPAPAS